MNYFNRLLVAGLWLLASCTSEAPRPEPERSSTLQALLSDGGMEDGGVEDGGVEDGGVTDAGVAGLSWSTTTLDFGTRDQCSPQTQTVTLFNGGSDARELFFASTQGPFVIKEIRDGNNVLRQLPLYLAFNESLTFTLEFTPRELGSVQGTLALFSDDPLLPRSTVSLQGAGSGAFIRLSTTSLDFGTVPENTTASQIVTVTNVGDASLTLQMQAPAQPFRGEVLPIPLPLPQTINVLPNSPLDLRVTFTPTAPGSFYSILPLLRTTSPCTQTFVVSLAGVAQQLPPLVADPVSLNFGPQRVGVPSEPLTVRIRNEGATAVALQGTTTSPGFTLVSTSPSPLPTQLLPDETADLMVTFTPSAAASFTGTLTLGTNSPVQRTLVVPLQGSGVRPVFTLDPTYLLFPPHQSGAPSPAFSWVVVKNERPFDVTLSASTSAPFSLATQSFEVPANGSYSLQVAFSPSASQTGDISGTVKFSSQGTPQQPDFTLPLLGKAVQTQLIATPSEINFNKVTVGQSAAQVLTLTNPTELPVTLYGIDVQAPFSAVLPTDRLIPANNGTLTVELRFSPTEQGTWNEPITIASSSTQSASFTIKGQGVATVLAVNPASPNFGDRVVNKSYTSQVTITNSGSVAARLTASVEHPFSVRDFPSGPLAENGGTATFTLVFTPTTQGSFTKRLLIQDAITEELLLNPEVSGTGIGPIPNFAPEQNLPFGVRQVGKPCVTSPSGGNTNTPLNVNISNSFSATSPLRIQGVSTSPPFRIIAPTDGTSLPTPTNPRILNPGDPAWALKICFEPTEVTPEGEQVERGLVISYEGSTSDKNIILSGRGANAGMRLTPSSLEFRNVLVGTSQELLVNLKNTGGVPVRLTRVESTDTAFLFRNLDWPRTLAPEEEVAFYVSFSPTGTGALTARIRITTESGDADQVLELSGTGAIAQATFIPSDEVYFGLVPVGEEEPSSVFIKNIGTAQLRIDRPVPSVAFLEVPTPDGGWPVVLDAQQQHELALLFKPNRAGALNGTLVIPTNSTPALPTLRLGGFGVGSVEVLPPAVEFGSANVGTTSAGLLTIRNNTTDIVKVLGFSSGNPDEFKTQPWPFLNTDIDPDDYLAVPLSFTPSARGLRGTTFTINVSGQTWQIPVQGIGTSPEVQLTPQAIDFGGLRVGTASSQRVVTLRNLDVPDAGMGGTLTLTGVRLDGSDKESFRVTVPQQRELPPGGLVEVPVSFAPTKNGRLVSSLWITTGSHSSDGGVIGDERAVTLEGVGLANLLEASTAEVNFGMQVGGRTSAPRTFRLTNKSTTPLRVRMDLTGEQFTDFTFQVRDLDTGELREPPFDLAAGKSAEVSVKFTPLSGTTSNARVEVHSDAGDDVTVLLKGSGVSSELTVDVESLEVDFGTVLAPAQPARLARTLTLTNKSSQSIKLTAITLEGLNPDHFELVEKPQDGVTLSPNQQVALKVGYRAQEATSSDAVLSVKTLESGDQDALRIHLLGRAVTNFLAVSPMTLEFGFTDIGALSDPQEIQITNESRTEQLVRVAENSNPAFELDASALDSPLAPGASASLHVTFHPSAGGAASGELRLHLLGTDTPDVVIGLSGQGRTLQGEGGGCSCGTGGGGVAALLGLLGLVVLRTRRRERL